MRVTTDQLRDTLLKLLEIYWLMLKHMILFFVPRKLRYKDVKGEIVLVTGAGSGLGRLLAIQFARRNAIVALWDVDRAGNEETKRLIQAEYGEAHVYHCDVSDREQVYAVAAKVKRELGPVTILVNNAGILAGNDFLDIPDAKIRKTMEVNAMGPMWTCKAFLPDMMENNHGHIVNIASMGGLFGCPKLSDYGASKHALVGFDESLKIELYVGGYTGVRTTCVCPTFFSSGLYQGLGRSLLFPELTPRYVCKHIISAVLSNQEKVLIPGLGKLLVIMKAFMPIDVGIRAMELAGSYETMRSFGGARDIAGNKVDVSLNGHNNNIANGKVICDS